MGFRVSGSTDVKAFRALCVKSVWSQELAAGRANAYGEHSTDLGEQRVLRAVHAEPLRAPSALWGVRAGELLAATARQAQAPLHALRQVNRHLLRDLIARDLWSEAPLRESESL